MELFSTRAPGVLPHDRSPAPGSAWPHDAHPDARWIDRRSRAASRWCSRPTRSSSTSSTQLDEGLSARDDLPAPPDRRRDHRRGVALWRPIALAFELTYFWALTATVQALLTPDLRQGFPDYRWWWFFVAHAGVVVAAVFLAWGRRRTPRPGAVPRVFAWSLGVTALAAAGTLAFDGNYMFLREPPEGGSLLDLMGPWPWYIASAAALALALFWLLDRPFDGRRGGRRPAVPRVRVE